ncbi:MAG: class I SAM-dependent methyltransferase [Spirochaetales bacterium]|nr:class I SAM-dependent methyltransferase [Spirochaetales bacterium]
MRDLNKQYGTSKNLETRISIYEKALNPESLQSWVARKIPARSGIKILELGCGNGLLWKDLAPSFTGCEITLSDMSKGMLDKARQAEGTKNCRFEVIDYHDIPYGDEKFDTVISNHNLYHASDLPKVLSEISRVLKKGGDFFATTNSSSHLLRLKDLLGLEKEEYWPNSNLTDRFGAENASPLLAEYFDKVDLSYYENELMVEDFSLIMNYFFSLQAPNIHEIARARKEEMEEVFQEEYQRTGYFSISTRACLFSCIK